MKAEKVYLKTLISSNNHSAATNLYFSNQISKQQPFKLKIGCSNQTKRWLQSQLSIHCSIRTVPVSLSHTRFNQDCLLSSEFHMILVAADRWWPSGSGCSFSCNHRVHWVGHNLGMRTHMSGCLDVLSRAKNMEIIANIFCFNYGPLLRPSS